jgi:hypothetical protein
MLDSTVEACSKAKLVAWLKAHAGQVVVLRVRGGALRLTGLLHAPHQLDACSTEITAADLDVGVAGLRVSLTLHEERLSVYAATAAQPGSPLGLSLPVSIAYADLDLLRVEDEHPRADSAGPDAAAAEPPPVIFPYDLLR